MKRVIADERLKRKEKIFDDLEWLAAEVASGCKVCGQKKVENIREDDSKSDNQ